ncbi:MAG: hypothetical protein R2744_06380 [Bacteroidales bacterium]
MEELGTHPSVYYLPPVDRMFPYESGLEGLDESVRERYNNVGPRELLKSKEIDQPWGHIRRLY